MLESLNKAQQFEVTADAETFQDCFGITGVHLWNKFVKFNHSVLHLWSYLDFKNREKLANYIELFF